MLNEIKRTANIATVAICTAAPFAILIAPMDQPLVVRAFIALMFSPLYIGVGLDSLAALITRN